MEQKELWKNITGTVCVLGLAFSTMSINSTRLVSYANDVTSVNYRYLEEKAYNSTNSMLYSEKSNVYVEKQTNQLEAEADFLFGKMREATEEESASVNEYIRNISKDTGVNFFELC